MSNSIFNPNNYFFNLHSLPHFISGVLIIAESLFVFLQNRKSALNCSFTLATFAAGIWLTGIGMMYCSLHEHTAFIWCRYYCWLGIIFIAPGVYLFSAAWEGSKKIKLISLPVVIGFVFYIFCISSTYLIQGVWRYPWGFYPKAGFLESLFLAWFLILTVLSFQNFIRSLKKEETLTRKKQVKLIIIAFAFGFIGSWDYLGNYGIPLYAFGGPLAMLFSTIMAYAIVNYKLMDIETVIHKTMMWIVASSIVFVPIVLLSYLFYPWYREASPLKVAFLCGAVFYFLVVYLKIIQPKIDHIFQRRKYDLEKASENFTLDLVHLKEPAELIKKIGQTLKDTLYPKEVSIFLYHDKSRKFMLLNSGSSERITELSIQDPFLSWLCKNDSIVHRDFIGADPKYESIRNHARDYFKRLDDVVLITPLVLDDKPLGIINLSKKSNLKRYSSYDFQFLKRLKNESTIALSNSLLYGRVEEEVRIRTDELVQIQKQLIQAEKLATVGTLAGGVAHEINNPLAAVLTNAQMLLMTVRDEEDKESLKLIEQAAKRCREIVQKLMVYSRKPLGGREIKEVNLEDALNNVLSFLEYQLTQDNIKVTTNLENPPFIIKGSQTELEQVFTNLILNAKDAIKHGKKSGTIDISLAKKDDKIIIKLKDDGIGISKEHISKIFDPFFTTKDVGKGTGLGLSICQSIVEQHSGTITVESREGSGATFIVTLPKR